MKGISEEMKKSYTNGQAARRNDNERGKEKNGKCRAEHTTPRQEHHGM